MTINEFSVIVLKSHSASSSSRADHPDVGLENVIHLIFLMELLVLLLVPDNPGLRWVFSDAVLPQRFELFHLRLVI